MASAARWGVLLMALLGTPLQTAATPDDTYARTVQPFLTSHCVKCHGETKAKGGIRFDKIRGGLAAGEDVDAWRKTLDQLHTGEMPPAKEPRPAAPQVDA